MSDVESDLLLPLSPIEAIRARPGMYIPQEGNVRNHLLIESLCLSLAEAHCGTCTEITIEASGRNVRISDNGLGLSLDLDETGMSFVERIFTQFHACRDHKAHQALGHELCGAGIVAVNALSSTFIVEIHTARVLHRVSYRDGIAEGPLQNVGRTSRTGTELRFTIAETYAGSEEFDLSAVRNAISAKNLDLSRTRILVAPSRDD